jgi:UDP-glucose:O-linked fucose beta-1,3-glucosyltransferase
LFSQDEVFRANQLFDEMKAQMKWDQQALEAWLEESAQKDEDVMALMKYTRQDEAKVKVKNNKKFIFIFSIFILNKKELMFKNERMTDEANKKKRAVEIEIMDTTSLQVN